MAACPVPMPPVRSSIVSVSVRSVIVTGRIVGRAVKHWHWKRNRESDENSSLGLRLEQHRHGKNKRKDQNKSSHIGKLPDEPADRWVTVGGIAYRRIGAPAGRCWPQGAASDSSPTIRQYLFKVCVSIPSLTKSLAGAFEQFQHNNLVENEKHQFVETPHWQDRAGPALGIVSHRLRG
jgi:hypothetical protein